MSKLMSTFVLAAAAALIPSLVSAETGPELPSWMQVDHAAKSVTMTIVAGQTTANNNWNMNGLAKGEATIVVPVGYTVEIAFSNNDPTMMVHSVGVGRMDEIQTPLFTNPTPVFDGAITAAAADPVNATKSGATETITFVADTAGDYALICYVPGHTLTGMWLGFQVSSEGAVGVQ